jgi:hypothetical protein
MESTVSEREDHDHCTRQFIELANQLKNEDYDIQIISAALMAASGIYATYSTAGNAGALEPSGVDKVVAVYRQNLEHIQERKKQELQGGVS